MHGWLRWDLMLNSQRGEVTDQLTSWALTVLQVNLDCSIGRTNFRIYAA